jgi:Domain of unknown function (DUF4932)
MIQQFRQNLLYLGLLLSILLLFISCNKRYPIIKNSYAKTFTDNHKVGIAVPEIYEMMLVASVLTEIETKSDYFIDTTTAYYRVVRETFGAHKNHPLVLKLNKSFSKDFWRVFSIVGINSQSICYDFENGKLKDINRYEIAWLYKSAPTPIPIFTKNKALIEDFYQKTKFGEFYKSHVPYYETLIRETADGAKIEDIWHWLEANFPTRKQSYRVITSPLLGGVHNTIPLMTKDKKISQMMCFISPVLYNGKTPAKEQFFMNQSMFMTEINENYAHVPPQYLPALKKAMGRNKRKWNNGNAVARHYKSIERTFNENFTHAVMACYGYDRYGTSVFEKKWSEWQSIMVEKRGFPMFKAFSDELLRLYINRNEGQTVYDLFAPMVEWVKKNA